MFMHPPSKPRKWDRVGVGEQMSSHDTAHRTLIEAQPNSGAGLCPACYSHGPNDVTCLF